MLGMLWPDGRGLICGESALGLYGLSDANPAKLHITVPTSYRTHREIPALYVLHREDLAEADRTIVEGVAVVSVAKAIRQAHEHHLRRSLVGRPSTMPRARAGLRRRQADELRRELLEPTA